MYKRKGCELFTIEDSDYAYLQGYNNEKEKEYGYYVKELSWTDDVDLLSQIDIIFEKKIEIEDGKFINQRFLGYFKDLKVDDRYGKWNICYNPVFVVCDYNYLEGVEIIKDIDYRGLYYRDVESNE